mmetsp:Transcript_3510/g.4705  ORF Transcript_3510/g.4705 Transcript_3510/m.4705 type:complete len:80 (-) Transcript_3510:107-346(-)
MSSFFRSSIRTAIGYKLSSAILFVYLRLIQPEAETIESVNVTPHSTSTSGFTEMCLREEPNKTAPYSINYVHTRTHFLG